MTNTMLLLILAVGTAALNPRPKHVPRYIFGSPYGGFTNQRNFVSGKISTAPYDCDEISYFERFISQPVDHFSNNSTSWNQFYQYNRRFYNDSSSLAFLILGSEEPINSKAICRYNIPYITWAGKYGAAVFQVEHRYYGRSRPAPTQSAADLKWFTPEQILADYNNFIEQMNKKYFGKKRMRWVLFGTSYGGVLAAWMRVAYPNSSIGAIASSSAIDLKVDNYNAAINMEKNYKLINQTCASNIGAAFKQIQTMSYSNSGRKQMEEIFNLCDKFPSTNELRAKDLQFFWANIFIEFQNLNQYSSNDCKKSTANTFCMSEACKIMNDASESDVVMRLNNFMEWVSSFTDDDCIRNNYEEYIGALANNTYDETGEVAANRSWIYQLCAYLGFFTTTSGSDIWGSILPIDFVVDQCIDMFGSQFNLDYIYTQVKKYRAMFGGAKDYKGSKIVFVNGNMDPWHSLSLTPEDANERNKVFSVIIDKGSHCSDMVPVTSQDSASLTTARAFIASKLYYFIRSG